MGAALFDAAGPTPIARYTALALDPIESLSWSLGDEGDPFVLLDAMHRRSQRLGFKAFPGPHPLIATLLSYDLGRTIETIPNTARAEGHLPDLWAARYDAAYVWDRVDRAGWLIGHSAAAVDRLAHRMANTPPLIPHAAQIGPVIAELDQSTYTRAIERILHHIGDGDVYQVNFALRFQAQVNTQPSAIFTRLHRCSQVPFAAALRLSDQRAIFSISPERYLRWNAAGHVETRPIKGTRPRGKTPEEDAALQAELAKSPKDAAEHLMIVDLERNDLGRVCEIGSVHVPRQAAPEAYATVHHLVSTVAGKLRPEVSLADLLRATFPGGSITGAPKIRAMEIIDRLEPVRRGPYCGAVGYLDAAGGGDLNLAIRTAWQHGPTLYYSAGGGIVADSTPAAEWAEAQVKAKAFIDALSD